MLAQRSSSALVRTAKIRNQSRCQSTGEHIKKTWYKHPQEGDVGGGQEEDQEKTMITERKTVLPDLRKAEPRVIAHICICVHLHTCVWHEKRQGTLREGEALGRREAERAAMDTSKSKVHWYTHKKMPSGNPLFHALTKNNSRNLKEQIERVPKLPKHTWWFSVKPKLSSEGRGSNSWKPHLSHVASGQSRQLPRPPFTTRKMGLTTSFVLAYLK